MILLSTFGLILSIVIQSHNSDGAQPITDDELKTFSETAFGKDNNNGSLQVVVKSQAKTRAYSDTDQAPLPLLELKPSVLKVATVARLMALYDNYDPDTTHSEVITNAERKEESDFLDAVLSTPIWAYTNSFLKSKGFVNGTKSEMKELLNKIWFTVYSRGNRKLGSSAFEHIFLGEIKRGEVSGLHNWIFFSHEEQNNHLNYLGYMQITDFNGKGGVIKLHYKWLDKSKPVGTLFVGTSPELELALYTVCYFARPNDKCYLRLNGKSIYIQTYTFTANNQKLIGSAFPSS
ncbi:endoribonuclease CG2145-like [Macrosteles quadrilineatus]|uniref:endoribonuclease CG2145-like n=1 Tax=Macrosteles quadrilineatus TaxID=74068 RepID=UPI0023E228F5|nr:endoribonuclease CG2145-like [Macrosteles quadrilineatus]